MKKTYTQRERVKAWLLEHGSMTNVEGFQNQILRLSERIRELEAEGFKINGDWDRVNGKRTQTYRYTLHIAPAAKPKLVPRMVDVNGVKMIRMVPG